MIPMTVSFCYTLVDAQGSQLSMPQGYDLNVGHFVEFLDNGLSEFKNRTALEIAGNDRSRSNEPDILAN
jgi:thiol:disulfide interchange protein DsbD